MAEFRRDFRLLIGALAFFVAWAQPASAGCTVALVPGAFAVGAASNWFLSPADYFKDYRSFFEGKGCKVEMIQFPPDGTIEQRGMVLRDQAERMAREQSGEGIYLVTHSQGALDARYALKSLGLRNVTGVASVGAPHRGTPVANWVLEARESRSLIYWLLRILGKYDLGELRFAGEFTMKFLDQHARHFEAIPSVRYGSARAVCRADCHWGLKTVAWWIDMDRSDGIVPEHSQSFGEDLGLYDLDHISEVDASPRKAGERLRLLERIWIFLKGESA